MPVWTARCRNQDPGCVSMGAIQRGTSWATIPKTLNRARTVHAPCAHRARTVRQRPLDHLLCAPPFVYTAFCVYRLACGPLNNKTPAVATDRLLCAPPCVCTAFYVHRLACGPLNNMTPAVATDRLLCAPPCVYTAFCVYRLACGPLNNKTPAVAIDRLLCAPPFVCTALSVAP